MIGRELRERLQRAGEALGLGIGCPWEAPAMTNYTVSCDTCLHRSTYPTHEVATAHAEAHAKTHLDHSVTVEQEPDEEENAPA